MVFLGVFMMPFYYGSRARSVPEYLRLRFDEKTRGLNAISFAVMTVFSSGISLYALAKMLEIILKWDFDISIWIAAGIVMIYTFMGGLTSAVYNEVLQFFLIVLGFSPLVIVALQDAGGWTAIKQQLHPNMTHAWKYMGDADQTQWASLDVADIWIGFCDVVWLLVHRFSGGSTGHDREEYARSADDTPIIAAIPKMLMPLIVVLPGVIAIVLMQPGIGYGVSVYPLMKTVN